MNNLPSLIPDASPAETLNTFSSVNRSDSTSSNSTSTTHESTSSGSNSPNPSNSSNLPNFEGTPVSFIQNPTLPPYLRNRILSNTPGTSHFSRETGTGAVHPVRATQIGRPAATMQAAAQRRNPQPLNAPLMRIQNPELAQLLAQNHFQRKPYFFPPTTPSKRTD